MSGEQHCTCYTRLLRGHDHEHKNCKRQIAAKCDYCDQRLCWHCADYHTHSSFSKIVAADSKAGVRREKGDKLS